MKVTIQSSMLTVTDVDQSIEFYKDVFGFQTVARRDRVAALLVDEADRTQVLVLREVENRYPTHPGRGSIGIRVLAFEVGSIDELNQIRQKLTDRDAYIGSHRIASYETVLGVDPDKIELAVASGLTGHPIQTSDWCTLDEMIETITD
jgi:catechol 2,3-dioxygenase-like lactoylglutathione lyase family enzyme